MLFTQTTFIGIDPTAGKIPFTYAALNHELKLLTLGRGDIEDVIAYVCGQKEALVAISAPRSPNQGLMNDPDKRSQLNPQPRPGRWTGYRVAEYFLRQHNIRIYRTPGNEANCPAWMINGFEVYRRLEKAGFKNYPSGDAPLQLMEVYPHACFCVWMDHAPMLKRSLEGRLQRQLVLHKQGLDLPDPMLFFVEITRRRLLQGKLPEDILLEPNELDALAGAYTAWWVAKRPDSITMLGDSDEGQVIIPTGELRASY
jgi:hypothetical protein